MELNSNNVDQAVPCFDPECTDEHGSRSVAEPEQDGDVSYFACRVCGGEFGYRRITPTTLTAPAGVCAAGIPQPALVEQRPPQLPLLQIRRPDARPT